HASCAQERRDADDRNRPSAVPPYTHGSRRAARGADRGSRLIAFHAARRIGRERLARPAHRPFHFAWHSLCSSRARVSKPHTEDGTHGTGKTKNARQIEPQKVEPQQDDEQKDRPQSE